MDKQALAKFEFLLNVDDEEVHAYDALPIKYVKLKGFLVQSVLFQKAERRIRFQVRVFTAQLHVQFHEYDELLSSMGSQYLDALGFDFKTSHHMLINALLEYDLLLLLLLNLSQLDFKRLNYLSNNLQTNLGVQFKDASLQDLKKMTSIHGIFYLLTRERLFLMG